MYRPVAATTRVVRWSLEPVPGVLAGYHWGADPHGQMVAASASFDIPAPLPSAPQQRLQALGERSDIDRELRINIPSVSLCGLSGQDAHQLATKNAIPDQRRALVLAVSAANSAPELARKTSYTERANIMIRMSIRGYRLINAHRRGFGHRYP
jgi:hypothetical protein